MMSESSSSSSAGIGICGLLGVAFVVLKLCDVIDWSWWWVTCPFWWWVPVVAAIFAVGGLILLCVFVTKKVWRARARRRATRKHLMDRSYDESAMR